MGHTTPDFEKIRADYLRDVQNIQPDAAIDADSDNFVRATATASAVDGLYRHQDWIARQIMPDTADKDNLEKHAAQRGLSYKKATYASGVITWGGRPLGDIPAGLVFTHGSGLELVSLDGLPAGDYSAVPAQVRVKAVLPGACPDYAAHPVKAQNAPSGMVDTALLTLSGGTDAESPAELLSRLLYYMRNPEGGGRPEDYERWAMSVPGVTWARCIPHRRGLGTVDVLILSAEGLPSVELLSAVTAEIDRRRPVTGWDFIVWAPQIQEVNFSFKLALSSGTLPALQTKVRQAVQGYFDNLKPGDGLILVRVLALLVDISSVKDAAIVLPERNIAPTNELYWLKLGEITLAGL